MNDFFEFLKNPENRIDRESQYTKGIEGYLYDGADGSQIAVWTCHEDASSDVHVHPFDEYRIIPSALWTQ